jgi:hypothetical protein
VIAGTQDRSCFSLSRPFAPSSSIGSRLRVPDRRDEQHVGAVLAGPHLEVVVDVLAEHDRREGPERLAELDLQVHRRLHLARARVADDAERAPSARARTPRSLKPPTTCSLAISSATCSISSSSFSCEVVDGVDRVEERADLGIRVARTEQRAVLGVVGLRAARLVEELVPGEERRAERSARVARRRLDPDLLEGPLAQDAPLATQLSATPPARA